MDGGRRVTVRDGLYGVMVTGYDEARSLLADPRLSKDPRRAPADWQQAGRGRPLEDRTGLGTHLLTTDPPEHTRLRRLIVSAFSPRRVEGQRDRMQRHAHALIDDFENRAEVDLIGEYAFPLAVTVLCELLGIPAEDRHTFGRWTSDVLISNPESPDARPAALRHLHGYVTELISAKRRRPGEDLTSALVTGHDDDGDLSENELISMLFLLLVTGHETTVNLIGNGILAFLLHPDQRELLRARPELLSGAVEEVLRHDSPVTMSTWRFTTEPMTISGTRVPAGEPILVALAAANRDPGRFIAPDRFDITADRAPHLGFGHGAHHCVGAGLARVEGSIGIGTLLQRLPDLALAIPEDHLPWRTGLTIRGVATLPVRPTRPRRRAVDQKR